MSPSKWKPSATWLSLSDVTVYSGASLLDPVIERLQGFSSDYVFLLKYHVCGSGTIELDYLWFCSAYFT